MRDPEEALKAAREAAASGSPDDGLPALDEGFVSARRLAEWAIIEPERSSVYSTRRLGAPLTWLKRLLVRLLRQYLDQITAQQSRFNAQVAAHVLQLEERVKQLERRAGDGHER